MSTPSSSSSFDAAREEVRAKTTLSSLIGEDVRLQRRGPDFLGLCPFHQEKTPSFKVNDLRGHYHCFGCGAQGDAFDYVMQRRHCTFKEALTYLADRAGVALPTFSSSPQEAQARRHRQTLLDVHQLMADYCAKLLRSSSQAEAARIYLRRRQISEAMIRAFRLGYDDGSVTGYLRGLGYTPDDLIEAGLATAREPNASPRDRFAGRITFPILDIHSRPIAFGGRLLADKAKVPKYLNSNETPLFHKGSHLYHLDAAVKESRGAPLVLVEGYMDVVSLVSHGFPQVVASLGTALTEDQIELLWKYDDHPILCFDGDAAGLRASVKAMRKALPLLRPGKTLFFCYLPEGLDPDDFVKAQGAEALQALLRGAKPLVDVLWQSCAASYNAKNVGREQWIPEDRAAFKQDLLEAAEAIRDTEIQGTYRRLLMHQFYAHRPQERGSEPASSLRTWPRQTTQPHLLTPKEAFNPQNIVGQKVLLGILLRRPALLAEVDELLVRVPFSRPELEALKEDLLESLEGSLPAKTNDAISDTTLQTHAAFLFQEEISDEEILRRWKEIWFRTVGYGQIRGDLKRLSETVKKDLNARAWEQLRALFFDAQTPPEEQ